MKLNSNIYQSVVVCWEQGHQLCFVYFLNYQPLHKYPIYPVTPEPFGIFNGNFICMCQEDVLCIRIATLAHLIVLITSLV